MIAKAKFSKTNADRRPNRAWPKINQLLFDFGLEESKQEDPEYVRKKIIELDQQFDLGSVCSLCPLNYKLRYNYSNIHQTHFVEASQRTVLELLF